MEAEAPSVSGAEGVLREAADRRASDSDANPHAGWCGRGDGRNPVTPPRLNKHLGANPKLAETAQSEDELRQDVAFLAARGPICGS